MKPMLIAGNWKMHTNAFEGEKLAQYIVGGINQLPDLKSDILVCPPFTGLAAIKKVIEGSPVKMGAQNCYPENKGAYTGEIAPPMLANAGCTYVIAGHSERREYFNESSEFVNKKVITILDNNMKAIMCIGESLEERRSGKTFDILKDQLDKGLDKIGAEQYKNLIIAYEPVWAIGTGESAEPAQVEEAHGRIREMLKTRFGDFARDMIILYGGSLKPSNAESILKIKDVNGGLIGGASLKGEDFLEIIKTAETLL
ncbi:MAG: triose-phosphate isomerase [Bacteroidota bacterium]